MSDLDDPLVRRKYELASGVNLALRHDDSVPLERRLTVSAKMIDDYVKHRALGKSWRLAAEKAGIEDYEEAKIIERSSDFAEKLEAYTSEIINDPAKAFRSLVPQAIGILMDEMDKNNISAAREVVKTASTLSKTSPVKEEEEDTIATRRPKESGDDRSKIASAARRLLEA